ncbi:MAG: hypothetical protein JST70_02750 [Bacteroidetes bacterium]|nr:hypothetical protein [Bacteroidota bacterium]
MRSSIFLTVLVIVTIFFGTMTSYSKETNSNLIEQRVISYIKAIHYWKYSCKDDNDLIQPYDSLVYYNKELMNYLNHACKTNPAIMNYNFDSAKNIRLGFGVVASEDKKLKYYYWNTETGGTMLFFDAIVQYSWKGNIRTKVLNDISDPLKKEEKSDCWMWYDTVYTLHTTKKKTVYIVIGTSVLYSDLEATSIESYCIENGALKHVPFFRMTKSLLSSIFYEYSIFANSDFIDNREKYSVHLSTNGKKLYIPVIQDETPTGKWIVYNYDGDKFVYDKNAK